MFDFCRHGNEIDLRLGVLWYIQIPSFLELNLNTMNYSFNVIYYIRVVPSPFLKWDVDRFQDRLGSLQPTAVTS